MGASEVQEVSCRRARQRVETLTTRGAPLEPHCTKVRCKESLDNRQGLGPSVDLGPCVPITCKRLKVEAAPCDNIQRVHQLVAEVALRADCPLSKRARARQFQVARRKRTECRTYELQIVHTLCAQRDCVANQCTLQRSTDAVWRYRKLQASVVDVRFFDSVGNNKMRRNVSTSATTTQPEPLPPNAT